MMETIRTAANNIVVKIIFGIIIVAFIFTGVGGLFGSNSNDEQLYIAKVDGEGINRATFEREAQYETQNAGALAGDDSFVKNIRRTVLSNQIDNYLSHKLADDLNVEVSDEQVKNIIRKQPVFFENGVFSNRLYLELLAANGYTPDVYAEAIRSSAKQEQVMKALLLSNFVTPENTNISTLLNQTRTIYLTDYTIANVDSSKYAVSEDELKNYYENNKNEFYHKKRVKVKFVTNFLPEIENSTIISDEQVKKYYEDGKAGVMAPEKHQYSVLSFDSLDVANKEYQAISELTNKDRADVEMENIGWLAMDDTLPELLKNANLTKVNDISQPIEQDGEFYIVRLNKIEKAQKYEFDFVKDSIKAKLYKEQVEKVYTEQQERLEKAAKLSSIEEIAKVSGLELHTSDWNYESESDDIGRFPEINEVIFSDLMVQDGKATNNISNIIHITQYEGAYIVQVTDYEDAGIPSFEKVKDEVKQKLEKQKKKQVFSQEVKSILAQLNEKGSADGIHLDNRIEITRDLVDSQIDGKTINDIFALVPNVGETSYGVTMLDDEKAQIYALIDVKNAEDVTDISTELKPKLINVTQKYLSADLRSKAKIEIMPNANL